VSGEVVTLPRTDGVSARARDCMDLSLRYSDHGFEILRLSQRAERQGRANAELRRGVQPRSIVLARSAICQSGARKKVFDWQIFILAGGDFFQLRENSRRASKLLEVAFNSGQHEVPSSPDRRHVNRDALALSDHHTPST